MHGSMHTLTHPVFHTAEHTAITHIQITASTFIWHCTNIIKLTFVSFFCDQQKNSMSPNNYFITLAVTHSSPHNMEEFHFIMASDGVHSTAL